MVTPAPAGALNGNRVTALRWARVLRRLGAHVTVRQGYEPLEDRDTPDLLVAIHAFKSRAAIETYRARHPNRPVVVAIAGTDLYGDADPQRRAVVLRSLEAADRIVVLHRTALDDLPTALHAKTRVILQSCSPPNPPPEPRTDAFEVGVVGHLREVKDPLLCARAARSLAASSAVTVVHAGAALDERWAQAATAEANRNPRYQWLGELTRQQTLCMIARVRLLVVTSKAEGGANVVSEALVCRTPVVSTRIAGSVGLLGEDYPGYVPVGDAAALSRMLARVENDAGFLAELQRRGDALRPRFAPQREQQAWASLIGGL
ncbi:MAG: TIGR04348 family glycosyltransferase [Nannocystaceae bacterium]|nr:TIGR04348 family glycosyltransferase [Nannocystaceae bacterium]